MRTIHKPLKKNFRSWRGTVMTFLQVPLGIDLIPRGRSDEHLHPPNDARAKVPQNGEKRTDGAFHATAGRFTKPWVRRFHFPLMPLRLTPSTGRSVFKIHTHPPSLHLTQSLGSLFRGRTLSNAHEVQKLAWLSTRVSFPSTPAPHGYVLRERSDLARGALLTSEQNLGQRPGHCPQHRQMPPFAAGTAQTTRGFALQFRSWRRLFLCRATE